MANNGLMVKRKPPYRLHSVVVEPDPNLPPPTKGAGKMAYESKARAEAVLANTSPAKPEQRQARKYAKAAVRDRKKRRRGLLASVDIPDALPPGSSIHLQFGGYIHC